jgi:hypothetical protein
MSYNRFRIPQPNNSQERSLEIQGVSSRFRITPFSRQAVSQATISRETAIVVSSDSETEFAGVSRSIVSLESLIGRTLESDNASISSGSTDSGVTGFTWNNRIEGGPYWSHDTPVEPPSIIDLLKGPLESEYTAQR